MSLPKLTALSTQTLSLLLERQRLSTLAPVGGQATSNTLHLPQITRNLKQLRSGILDLEVKDGRSEAVVLMRNQYERMRGMLGFDADKHGLESFDEGKGDDADGSPSGAAATLESEDASGSSTPEQRSWRKPERSSSVEAVYTPYTDDPEAGMHPSILLQEQRRQMDTQDDHLDHLSRSINRQRDISLQINDELDVHTGLLEGLDVDLENTSGRLGGARRQLDRVAKGAKEHGSTMTIALLILVLLVLIIVFKT
ncbi:hypothetical protein FA95DRAFT_1485286 [Auriscalpium vulgare]|uniref:Uncharacterized protein n=1 Tax=Auriscalpium vulgare TaxID=40419 RepID=A0ACB8S609_9AGAM|nr:hypothetical protein FA95DRAFT_1485286 [Auriscalpium vulgare]